jgi:2'-5' RNA ligase
MRANWFIGLAASAPLGLSLGPPPPRLRVFHPDDLHLTLAFLGACGAERARAAWGLLADEPLTAVPATLAPLAPLGPPARWSALSADVDEGRGRLVALMERWRDPLLAAAGARPDRRAPRPHLTVARPQRRATEAERVAALAWGRAQPVAGTPVLFDRLRLYTWAADRAERLFAVVEDRALVAG